MKGCVRRVWHITGGSKRGTWGKWYTKRKGLSLIICCCFLFLVNLVTRYHNYTLLYTDLRTTTRVKSTRIGRLGESVRKITHANKTARVNRARITIISPKHTTLHTHELREGGRRKPRGRPFAVYFHSVPPPPPPDDFIVVEEVEW